jgi:hypothetical protein
VINKIPGNPNKSLAHLINEYSAISRIQEMYIYVPAMDDPKRKLRRQVHF